MTVMNLWVSADIPVSTKTAQCIVLYMYEIKVRIKSSIVISLAGEWRGYLMQASENNDV